MAKRTSAPKRSTMANRIRELRIGITMADFDGRFCTNSAFLNILGYTESELYQLTFVDVTYEEDRKANLELVRELIEGARQSFQIESATVAKTAL